MMAHVYFNEHLSINGEYELHTVTSRVTVGDMVTPGQQSLILGTRGSKDFQYYPMSSITYFWIEEN